MLKLTKEHYSNCQLKFQLPVDVVSLGCFDVTTEFDRLFSKRVDTASVNATAKHQLAFSTV